METITVIEAVRRATDPFGMEGMSTASSRVTPAQIIERLERLGFEIVPRGNHRFVPSCGASSPCARCGAWGSAPIHKTTT